MTRRPAPPAPAADPTATHGPTIGPVLSRRRALQLVGAAVLGATLLGCGGDDRSDDDATDVWTTVADAARRDDPTIDARRAEAELVDAGLDPSSLRRDLPSTLRRDLEQRIRDDFAAGRTVPVAGWLLARTEVLLCVVVAEGAA